MAVEQLPEETLLLVLQHLAVQGLAAMLATSKRLRGLACETIRLRVEAALRQTVQSYDVLNPVAVLNAVLRHAARAGDGLLVQWLMRRAAELGMNHLKLGAAAQIARGHGHPRLGTWILSQALHRTSRLLNGSRRSQ